MELGKAGWLSSVLEEVVAAHAREPEPVVPPGLPDGSSGRARARAYLRRMMRASGLLYGTPAQGVAVQAAPPAAGAPARAPEELLFLAVVRTLARMALDVARLTGAPEGPRREQLLLLFAVFAGEGSAAELLDKKLRAGQPVSKRLAAKVEAALEQRAGSLAGDPVYGLVLHNGALYADAQMFGRQAIAYFLRGHFDKEEAQRRTHFAAQQKALLVDVLTDLACVDRLPDSTTRRTILRQVEGLGLPAPIRKKLKAAVKLSFEGQRRVRDVVREVRSVDLRHFILEQTLLASLVDGRRTRGERAFIEELASALHVSAGELRRLEVEMAEFYAHHRSVVDVFTVSAAADVMGEDLMDNMQEAVTKNFHRLMQEIRETGELSVLLARVARGQTLTAEERKRMRAQLIDVAKAIPALAIFAAPGGMLLLLALAKVLPFNLLPSSFQDEPAHAPPPARDDEEERAAG
ncbi:LETM1 domain-containing protein [Myxococcaceae bacterium GXIMD 01537]